MKAITKTYPTSVELYCLLLIATGAITSMLCHTKRAGRLSRFVEYYKSGMAFRVARIASLVLALMMVFGIGPDLILEPKISMLMWKILVYSVGVIIPIGAVFLNILIHYGCLEFIGTLMRPVMRPLFRLPGRSALDDLTSWVGSYSVGLYITRKLVDQGYYNRREAYTIITCFSTVSIGFVGIVAATLDLLHLFPIIFLTYFLVIYLLAMMLVRCWPITRIPETYIGPAQPEEDIAGSYLRMAWQRAITRAGSAPGFGAVAQEGFVDGLKLASTILGTILAVGTVALLVADLPPEN